MNMARLAHWHGQNSLSGYANVAVLSLLSRRFQMSCRFLLSSCVHWAVSRNGPPLCVQAHPPTHCFFFFALPLQSTCDTSKTCCNMLLASLGKLEISTGALLRAPAACCVAFDEQGSKHVHCAPSLYTQPQQSTAQSSHTRCPSAILMLSLPRLPTQTWPAQRP